MRTTKTNGSPNEATQPIETQMASLVRNSSTEAPPMRASVRMSTRPTNRLKVPHAKVAQRSRGRSKRNPTDTVNYIEWLRAQRPHLRDLFAEFRKATGDRKTSFQQFCQFMYGETTHWTSGCGSRRARSSKDAAGPSTAQIVESVLQHETGRLLSDKDIARECGVPSKFVSEVRGHVTFVNENRAAYHAGELPRHQQEMLESLAGWSWELGAPLIGSRRLARQSKA